MLRRPDVLGAMSFAIQFVGLAMSLALFGFAAWLFCVATPSQSTAEADTVAEVGHGE